MDPLTHALSGALVARATASPEADRRSLRQRLLAGVGAATFPDIDYVIEPVSAIAYLEMHRGPTHSVLLLPLWALGLAWLFARLARDPRGFAPWLGICTLGIAAHIAGDLITSYGTMILAPLSWRRFGLGTTFIIDLWLSGLIVAGLAGSLVWRRSRVPTVVAFAGVAGYIAVQAVAKERAEAFAAGFALQNGWTDARVVAQPRPVSPFNWTVFIARGEDIALSHVNVVRDKPQAVSADGGLIARLGAPYRPLKDAHWERSTRFGETAQIQALARSAWQAQDLAFFRRFADLPVYDGLSAGSSCVWFRDLRFETPGREALPFRFGVCRAREGDRWALRMPDPG